MAKAAWDVHVVVGLVPYGFGSFDLHTVPCDLITPGKPQKKALAVLTRQSEHHSTTGFATQHDRSSSVPRLDDARSA